MRDTLATEVARRLASASRWTPLEIAFWLVAAAAIWLLPNKHLILAEIAILALFALSLDLILGYAGIISLGHAAFFGFGDVAGKYYAPQFGSFIIYIIMIVVLIWRPQGLFSRAIAK